MQPRGREALARLPFLEVSWPLQPSEGNAEAIAQYAYVATWCSVRKQLQGLVTLEQLSSWHCLAVGNEAELGRDSYVMPLEQISTYYWNKTTEEEGDDDDVDDDDANGNDDDVNGDINKEAE